MGMMLIVVAMDAFQAIPFAYLRYKKRPVKFAALKLLFIFASIVLNIAYFVGMKGENVGHHAWSAANQAARNRTDSAPDSRQ